MRRALESSNGHNLAFLGVKDDYIVIAYKSDLNRAQPMFNRYMSGANVDAPIQIPAARFGAADMWRHPSNPTRLYTADEMSDIIHRTRQYGGDPSAMTGWEPVETVSGVTRTPVAEAKHTPPVQPTTGNQNNRTLADDLLEERRRAQQASTPQQTTTPTQQKSLLDIAREADEAGRKRIESFRAKYDLSTNGRLRYTKQQWRDIFDREIGWSDVEDTFRDDFFRDYDVLRENRGF